MRRHATTIVLFVLAVLLGTWVWIDRNTVTEGEKKLRENNVFPAWRREDITKVEIVHEGETIVLERDKTGDAAFRMTAPLVGRADQAAVERLLTTLEFATRVRKVESGSKHDTDLGLDAPRARGVLTMGALVFRFALGGPSPRPEGSAYVRVDDGPAFVASKELADALVMAADAYRDRTVVPYLSLDLQRFEVRHDGGGFSLERIDDRSFTVTGRGLLASRTDIDKVWAALAEMRAEVFPKDADAARLTSQRRVVIRMVPKDSKRPEAELVVGDACPGHPTDVVVLRTRPTPVATCAPKGAIDALVGITPDTLVDRSPFSFRHDEIEELRLERLVPDGGPKASKDASDAPQAIEVARRGTGFHLREPEDRELSAEEADAMSEVLVDVERIAPRSVRPGDGAPFDAIARARVRAGDRDEVVEVGPADLARDTVVLRRVRDDARLDVPLASGRRLVPRRTTYRPRTLLDDRRKVKRVVLRCGTAQELVDEGRGLTLIDPAGFVTDGSIVQLVDGLQRGKVLSWVADRDDGTFGLAGDGCRVVLAFEDDKAPVTVRFGREAEGGVYGVVDGKPDVFVAPTPILTLASRIYVSHATLREEASRIESVRVNRAKGPLPLHDPAALKDAAAGLFADRVVALGTTDIGPVETEIVVSLSEGGPPKRILCGALVGSWHRCATSGTRATFDVHETHLRSFFSVPGAADAGGRVVDAGLRD